MGIKVYWDHTASNIMHVSYPEKWTWEALYASQAQANEMLESTRKPVIVVIHDMHRFAELPLSGVHHIPELVSRLHPAMHLTIFVGMSRLVRMIWDVAMRVRKPDEHHQFAFAFNMEEAIQQADNFLRDHAQVGSD